MITWAVSADKHGILREDAVHAMLHAYYIDEAFDEPRVPTGRRPTLYLGPPRQLGGALLEVMVEVRPPRDVHVFHVMIARPKNLARLEDT